MRGRKPQVTPKTKPTGFLPPAPPSWLCDDARAEWDRVVKLIGEAGAVATADADLLAAYVETLVTYRRALRILHVEGLTYTSDDGLIKRHPATAIASDARKDLIRMAAELGMTPIARQRLKIDGAGDDALGDFLAGGAAGMKIAQ